MPDETYYEILDMNTPPPGGKAVAGMAPELQQQSTPEASKGKLTVGMGPENPQTTSASQIEPPVTPSSIPTAKAVVQNPTGLATKQEEPQSMTYTEMLQRYFPYEMPTKEEVEAQKKREKQKRMWAAIGDGIAAVSNLYFAGKTGFSNYSSMSAPLNDRLDKMRKERDDNSRQYLLLYMAARQYDEAAERWQKDFAYRTAQDKARAAEDARRWNAQFEYRKDRDAVADGRYEDTLKRQDKADKAAGDVTAARIKTEASRQAANYAQANQRNAAARNGGGSGGRGSKYTLQIGNETKEYGSVSDYNRDVEAYAAYYGIDLYVYEGSGRNKKQKRKPTAQLAAEVEAASGVEKKDPKKYTPVGTVEEEDFNLDQYEEK